MADAGAAAPDQPDLSRTGVVLPSVSNAERARFQRHVTGRFYARRGRSHGLRHRERQNDRYLLQVPDRLRRRPLAGAQENRRDTERRRRLAACAVELHSRAEAARHAAGTGRQSGNVYAIDGKQNWLVHVYLKPGITDFEAVDRDAAIRTVLGVDQDFEYELLSKEDWVGRRLLVDKVRDDKVFICGDACHLWVPYAGYGMNAGIADAANLAWLLAARLEGWGGTGILAAYAAERLPITDQVSHFAMGHAHAMANARKSVNDEIEADGPEADAYRAAVGKTTYDLNVQQYCCAGLNFGYFYQGSPIIVYDGEAAPPYTMGEFTPSTVPGARLPHIWLADRHSLYDALGPYYTLLRLDPNMDVSSLTNAAAAACVPLTVLDVSSSEAAKLFARNLILVRPDQHVAWRGNSVPANPAWLVNIIRGAVSAW